MADKSRETHAQLQLIQARLPRNAQAACEWPVGAWTRWTVVIRDMTHCEAMKVADAIREALK
jgi:hypothetical protein